MNSLPDDVGRRLRESLNHGAAPELSTDLVTGAAAHPAPKLANPRARVQIAGGATALVAAVAVVAVLATSGLGRSPLFTEAASSSTNGAAPAALPTSGLMRIWADYVYHAGAGLSTSGGNGDVYQLVLSGSASDRADSLATVFGIASGSATVDNSDPANPLWTVGGSADSTAPSLQLTWSGAGDWWYSDPSADPVTACPPTVGGGIGSGGSGSGATSGSATGSSGGSSSSSSGATTGPDCTITSPPTVSNSAPVGDDARTKAQAIFAATGLNVAASDITVSGDSTGSTASANLVVGGVKTALDWDISWSGTGQISSASGESVSAVDRGSYGTISASDAVQRLSDGQWSGEAGPGYQAAIIPFAMLGVGPRAGTTSGAAPAPGVATSTPNDDATPAPTPLPTDTPTDVPTDAPTAEPTAVPTPEPTPTGPPIVNVTINRAEATLLLVWDSKGNAWLVPGYALKVENGWWDGVVSLVPGVIALPPAPSAEPIDGVAP